ncbi:hypothetical protein A6V25_30750 [Nostoc sp. ATCC 53789]|nr:hypothetical protein A6V25_30750 [Nostoc sp. ATCC 53789]
MGSCRQLFDINFDSNELMIDEKRSLPPLGIAHKHFLRGNAMPTAASYALVDKNWTSPQKW